MLIGKYDALDDHHEIQIERVNEETTLKQKHLDTYFPEKVHIPESENVNISFLCIMFECIFTSVFSEELSKIEYVYEFRICFVNLV